MTPVEKALPALRAADADAREAVNYLGKCKAPYAVIYSGGEVAAGRTLRRLLVCALLHAPTAQPGALDALEAQTDAALRSAGFRLQDADADSVLDNYEAITRLRTYYLLGGH